MHEFVVLMRLAEEDEVAQAELPFEAAIDPAAVSRLIRDMTKAGLVSARVDPTDKRPRFVKISPKGRVLLRTLSPIVDSTLAPYMAGLSEDEEQEFLHLLRKGYETVVRVAESEARASVREPSAQARGPAKTDAAKAKGVEARGSAREQNLAQARTRGRKVHSAS
jgi:DNA-binding MarR family transcriptional regulator